MTVFISGLIFLICIALAWRNYFRLSYCCFSLGTLIFGSCACGPVPYFLLGYLQINDRLTDVDWQPRNTLILLGGGVTKRPDSETVQNLTFTFARLTETARLYNICKKDKLNKCRVIASGGDPAKLGKSEAEVMQNELVGLGVSPEDITLEDRSLNTYHNAKFTAAILKDQDNDLIILVTSGLHMERSKLYFQQFDVNPIPAPADYLVAPMSLIPIAYNLALTDFAIHEFVGMLRLRIYNQLGWNATASEPGDL